MSILSVDLGTSNTVAVLAAHGRAPRVVEVDGAAAMPSAVFAAEDGRLVVGREAERRARLDPARFEPNAKRRIDDGQLLLGDRVVSVTEVFAAVLSRVGAETVRQLGGARPDEVRLTHPAQWGPVRRNVLLSAARQASLGTDVVLVPEPVAAAAHFASFPGCSLGPDQALAVYDLGAGTFDVAVVGATPSGFTVLAEAGLPDLGGLDVDQALLSHVGTQISQHDPHGWQRLLRPESTADRRAARALREDVRAAKEALSNHPQTDLPLPEPFPDVLVTRAELEALIRPNLLRSVELLASTVRSAGVTSLAGVYLVGGSSRIPLVAQLIGEQLRLMPTNLDQPETAVALGVHHVSREGMSLRTENLPPAVAAEERTASIAPPRPPAQPPRTAAAQPTPPIPTAKPQSPIAAAPSFGPIPPGPPPHARPVAGSPPHPMGPVPGTAPPRSRRRRVLLVFAAILVVLAGAWGVVVYAMGDHRTAPRTKQVGADAPCEQLANEELMSNATGEEAKADGSGQCAFTVGDKDILVITHDVIDTNQRETEIDGMPSYETNNPGQCVLAMKVSNDDPVWLGVQVLSYGGRDVCGTARDVLKAVFDNLPDA